MIGHLRNFGAKKDRYGYTGKAKAPCRAGHTHDSKEEARYCDSLFLQLKAKVIKGYDVQKTFKLEVNGHLICSHRVDFVVETKAGKKEVHEYKGRQFLKPGQGDVWKLKRKLFEALFPEIKYRVITK